MMDPNYRLQLIAAALMVVLIVAVLIVATVRGEMVIPGWGGCC